MNFTFDLYWIICLAIVNSIFLLWSLKKEKYIIAFITFSFFVFCFTKFDQFSNDLLLENIKYIGYYFLTGFVFSIIAWIIFVIKIKYKNILAKKKWLKGHKELAESMELKVYDLKKAALKDETQTEKAIQAELFQNSLKECNGLMTENLKPFWLNYELNLGLVCPTINKFKLKIISWVVFWPFILLLILVEYPLRLFPVGFNCLSYLIWRIK